MAYNTFVSTVRAFDASDKAAHGATQMILSTGTHVQLPRDDRRYPAWTQIIERQRAKNLPVYVEVERDGHQARAVFAPSVVRIDAVDERGSETIEVAIRMKPSMYHLQLSHPQSAQFRQLLVSAQSLDTDLLVTVHPSTLDVLDVRRTSTEHPGN